MPLVTERLKSQGVPFEILFHQPTMHARDEAHRLGVPLTEVVKTILIETRHGSALTVIPSSRRIDMSRVHRATGDPHARLATEAEMLRHFPDYPLGTLPPLSSELDIPIYVDLEVVGNDTIVFATSPTESIRVPTDEVLAGSTTTVAELVERPINPELISVAEEVELRASTEIDEVLYD